MVEFYSPRDHLSTVVPAFAGTHWNRHPEVRALASLEGWPQSPTLNNILQGSPETASTSRVNAIAFIPGMTSEIASQALSPG
jgi:hypothetical protein